MYPWLHLGPIVISTYSLMFLCAYIVGGSITYYEAKRQHRATEAILRVALGALAGGMLDLDDTGKVIIVGVVHLHRRLEKLLFQRFRLKPK